MKESIPCPPGGKPIFRLLDQQEPRLSFHQWKELDPEKAAAYLAQRRGWDAGRQRKLQLILEDCWPDQREEQMLSEPIPNVERTNTLHGPP